MGQLTVSKIKNLGSADKLMIDLKTQIRKDICTPMLIAALVTVAGTWKQPKRPTIDDRLKKLWYKELIH